MRAERDTPSVQELEFRLEDIERRVNWCEAWAARTDVKKPQITQEWLNLLDDVRWLLRQYEGDE